MEACVGGFEKKKKVQTQKCKPESIKLVKNVAWLRVGASKPVCNVGVASGLPREAQCMAQLLCAHACALTVLLGAGK